ncbi:hypothetical protein BGW42_006284 [Actinomortierella wolfii]|nr:hypothetical protein BGW42_006284 [Actinomortierella wolfii]
MATPKQTLASSGTPVGVEIDDRDDLWDLDCLSLAWCLTQMQACLDTPGSDANPFVFVPHEPGTDPSTVRSSPPAPFKLRNNQVRFYLYVSQAPCGDATTETLAQIQTEESKAAFYSGRQETTTSTASSATTAITMEAAQDPAASVHAGSKHNLADKSENLHRPKITKTSLDVPTTTLTPTALMPTQATSSNSHSPTEQGSLSSMVQDLDLLTSKDGVPGKSLAFRRGRVDYDCLTALRTKPGRVDSEPTLSMSCSDKMARWTVLGLTSAPFGERSING